MAAAEPYDAVVVGGGPAGLSAGLWLARYRRRVVVFDSDEPRNAVTWAVHGYFGIPDPSQEALREAGRVQAREAGAEVELATVCAITGQCDDFRVTLKDGREFATRRILLATGLRDIKPEIPGFDDFYGTSIWHCPDCDGPSVTDCRVGVLGWGACVGREAGYFDPIAYLQEQTGRRVDRDAMARLRTERFYARIRDAGALPGVAEALAAARALELKLGLASSSGSAWVRGQLVRLDLLHYFDCIRTADDVTRVKPDPELYLSVLRCLGVEPRAALAIEDSPNGALAARRAGTYCVVVPNPITAGLDFGDHDLRLESLHGVDLAELIRRLGHP